MSHVTCHLRVYTLLCQESQEEQKRWMKTHSEKSTLSTLSLTLTLLLFKSTQFYPPDTHQSWIGKLLIHTASEIGGCRTFLRDSLLSSPHHSSVEHNCIHNSVSHHIPWWLLNVFFPIRAHPSSFSSRLPLQSPFIPPLHHFSLVHYS